MCAIGATSLSDEMGRRQASDLVVVGDHAVAEDVGVVVAIES